MVDLNWRTYTVATAAQIEANRRNAQKSTGPKTERGKARAKLNAIKHGLTARTIMSVLPQEDPVVSLMIRRTTRLESCPTREWTQQTDRTRALATGRACLPA